MPCSVINRNQYFMPAVLRAAAAFIYALKNSEPTCVGKNHYVLITVTVVANSLFALFPYPKILNTEDEGHCLAPDGFL